MRSSILLCLATVALATFFGSTAILVKAQDSTGLQPGFYIYLGMQPGRSVPRAFSINSAGGILWQDPNKSPDDKVDPPPRTTGKKPAATNLSGSQFEEYNYPIIKWKPKPISGVPGAIVQLSTTYEISDLKYKLTLFRAPTSTQPKAGARGIQETASSVEIPSQITVQTLDANGFKLTEFTINQRQWEQIPGTSVLEARDKIGCNEWDYRRARDYSVKLM